MPNYGDKSVPKCSFCGKSEFMVDRLLYGSTAFICDECVNLCYQMLHEEDEEPQVKTKKKNGSKEAGEMPLLKPAEIKAVLDEYVIG